MLLVRRRGVPPGEPTVVGPDDVVAGPVWRATGRHAGLLLDVFATEHHRLETVFGTCWLDQGRAGLSPAPRDDLVEQSKPRQRHRGCGHWGQRVLRPARAVVDGVDGGVDTRGSRPHRSTSASVVSLDVWWDAVVVHGPSTVRPQAAAGGRPQPVRSQSGPSTGASASCGRVSTSYPQAVGRVWSTAVVGRSTRLLRMWMGSRPNPIDVTSGHRTTGRHERDRRVLRPRLERSPGSGR